MPIDGSRLDRYLSKNGRKFIGLLKKVRRKLLPADLHELRILTRRLRAVVWISRHSSNGPSLKRLRVELRDLGHVLGERRTLDVMRRDARRYRMSADRLDFRSVRAAKQVRRSLRRQKRERLSELLEDATKKLSSVESHDACLAVAEMVARTRELGKTRPQTPQEWHRVRIEVKKIRYAAEALGLKMPELKKIQDILGKGNDLQVLRDSLGDKRGLARDENRRWTQARRKMPQVLSRAEKKLRG